ncbi:hypothetical protein Btru_064644 [Bulinus truncatus]|nr:hypothetical protein Btru_064644 [Bulinus truncatus]
MQDMVNASMPQCKREKYGILHLHVKDTVTAQTGQLIVDRTQYYVGDTFNITCDITKFSGVPTSNYLTKLALMRQTLTETKFTEIATYQPFLPVQNDRNVTTLPVGRQWIVQYSGGDGYNNRQTMKIVTTVVGLWCDDAGLYKCVVAISGNSNLYDSAIANLTVKAQISQDDINVTPHNGDDPYSSSYQMGENDNITITMTCTFTGPGNLKAVWKQQSAQDSNEQNYPYVNDIVDETSVTSTSAGCTSSSYRSTLSFQLQPDNDGAIYFCTVVDNNVEVSRANFTIGITTISGCPAGLWGTRCEQNCSKKCFETSCNQLNGECNRGCLGYEDPPDCNLRCRHGFYGKNCSSACSSECNGNLCHYVNGTCYASSNGDTATAQTGQPIVDRTQYYVGDTFNITCDITKFSGVPTSNYLTKLALMRQTLTETKFTTIATYQPFLPNPNDQNVTTLPSGRQWIVQYSGGGGTNNRQTIKIVTTVVNLRCDDAGLYKCIVELIRDPTPFDSTIVNLTVKAQISQDDLSVSPHNGDDPYSSTYQLGENDNITITMSCTFRGPGNLKAVWKWQSVQDSNEQNYPTQNDIVDETPVTSIIAGCTSSSYRSTLSFQLQPDNDGAIYYCIVVDNNMEMSRANFTIGITTITAQTGQTIVDRTQYYVGDTFNITCDITKFSGQLPTSNYLTSLSLMRQTLTETKFTTIATYQPFAAPSEQQITTLPSDRQWIVQCSGGDGYNNRQTMKIVTTVVGLRCDDAGLYICIVLLPGSPNLYDSTFANLTVKAQISQDDLNVSPHNGDDPYSASYQLKDTDNVTIIMSCTFRGPEDLKAVWKWKLPQDSNEQNYPTQNDIVDETPVTSTSAGCTSSSYRSTLSFQLQPDNDGTTYYCTIEENNVEMSRANFTIGITKNTVTQTGQQIVDSTQYNVGDTFNITCDITKFSGPLPTSTYLTSLSLMRQTLTETKFTTIATYQPFLLEQNVTTLPSGRQWIVQYSGGGGANNRQTMKIVTTVVGLRCDDAGLYKCVVIFPGSPTLYDSTIANLTVKATAQTGQPIVDRTQYYVGDTFNITCDITKFSGVLASNYLITLSLMRQTLTETRFTTIATYQPFVAPSEQQVTTLPSGRQWIVQYSGGGGYNNKQTMKIVTTVVGVRCDDAGLYKCAVVFPGSPTSYDSTIANLTVKATAQTGQPIVDRTQYYVGDTFNITCDITKFCGVPTSNYLTSLSLMRQTLTETKYTTVATYEPFLPNPNDQNVTALPSGRQWIVQYSGGWVTNNRQTMKIVTTVVGLRCDDAGLYKCIVEFPRSFTPFDSTIANLTVKAQISQDDISVSPHNGDDPYSSTYQLKDAENVTIVMTCTFRGPGDLRAVWKLKLAQNSNEQNYPYVNDIVDETPVTSTGDGCTSSSYRSTLIFQLQPDNDGTTYYCIVEENNVEMNRANFTIGITTTTAQTGQPIVDRTQYYVGDTFNITCDITKFSGVPASNYLITLSLMRQTLTETRFTTIATYQPFVAPSEQQVTTLPSG